MGRGIALQFKEAYPENYRQYRAVCDRQELAPGRMFVFDAGFLFDNRPRYIINFPTKKHWKGKSKLEWIESGLEALVKEITDRQISSVAVPALGCDNGGLDWSDVKPLLESALGPLNDVHVLLYAPLSRGERVGGVGSPQAVGRREERDGAR